MGTEPLGHCRAWQLAVRRSKCAEIQNQVSWGSEACLFPALLLPLLCTFFKTLFSRLSEEDAHCSRVTRRW